jgi:hypothetical protein
MIPSTLKRIYRSVKKPMVEVMIILAICLTTIHLFIHLDRISMYFSELSINVHRVFIFFQVTTAMSIFLSLLLQ